MSALLLYPDDMSVNDESAYPAAPNPAPAPPADEPCVDWIRIFAARLALQRQELSAEQVIQLAITEFKISHCLAPEDAAALCVQRHFAGA